MLEGQIIITIDLPQRVHKIAGLAAALEEHWPGTVMVPRDRLTCSMTTAPASFASASTSTARRSSSPTEIPAARSCSPAQRSRTSSRS